MPRPLWEKPAPVSKHVAEDSMLGARLADEAPIIDELVHRSTDVHLPAALFDDGPIYGRHLSDGGGRRLRISGEDWSGMGRTPSSSMPSMADVPQLQVWFKMLMFDPVELRRALTACKASLEGNPKAAIRAAASVGALEALRWLDEAGIDLTDGGGSAVRAAAKGGHVEVLKFLDSHGLDPAEGLKWAPRAAAEKGHLQTLRWLLNNVFCDDVSNSGCLVRGACQGGQLGILQWLEDMHFCISEGGSWAVRVAAQLGEVRVLQWLFQHGLDVGEHGASALRGAAAGGHLEVICLVESQPSGPCLHTHAKSLLWAACEGGHVNILECLHKYGIQCRQGGGAAVWVAARGGHLDVLQWLDANGLSPSAGGSSVVQAATAGGYLDVLKWLAKKGIDVVDRESCVGPEQAAERGHIAVLQWLVDKGMLLEQVCAALVRGASKGGQLGVLQWLHEQGVAIRAVQDGIQVAAARGRKDILRWLVKHNANLIDGGWETCRAAAEGGHLDLLIWLTENGISMQKYAGAVVVGAAKGGHMDILCWLSVQDVNWKGHCREAVQEAAASGNIEVLNWLHQQGTDIREGGCAAICRAAEGGHLETLRWLTDHGINMSKHWHAAVWAASEAAQPDVHRWLLEGEEAFRSGGPRKRKQQRHMTPRVLSMPLRRSEGNATPSSSGKSSATLACSGSGMGDSLKWMLQYTLEPEEDIYDYLQHAASEGSMEVMHWIATITEHRWAVKLAVQGGHLCALKWLVENGLDLRGSEEQAVRWAAEAGHMNMLAWFRSLGMRLGSRAIDAASGRGSGVLLELLRNFQLPLSQHPSLAEDLLPCLSLVTPTMLANFILCPCAAAEGTLDSILVETAVSDHRGRPLNRAAMSSYLHARTFPHEPDFHELQRTLAPSPHDSSVGAAENVPVKLYRLAVPGAASPIVLRALAVTVRLPVYGTLAAKAIVVSAWQKVRFIYICDVLLEMVQLAAFVHVTTELKPRVDEQTEYEKSLEPFQDGKLRISMGILVVAWLKSFLWSVQRIHAYTRRGWGKDLWTFGEVWHWVSLIITGTFLGLTKLGTSRAVAGPLLSLVGFIRWWMVLYSLRAFNYFGQRILPILGAFREILPFIVVMVFYGGALVHALYALSINSVWDVFTASYRLGLIGEMELGEVVWGTTDSEAPPWWQSLQQLWFIMGAFLFTVALMNIFIAIMSGAFDRKEERAESDFLRTRSAICLGYILSYWDLLRSVWPLGRCLRLHSSSLKPPFWLDSDEVVWLCHQHMPRNALEKARSLREMISFATEILLTETDAKLQAHQQAIHAEMDDRFRRITSCDDGTRSATAWGMRSHSKPTSSPIGGGSLGI